MSDRDTSAGSCQPAPAGNQGELGCGRARIAAVDRADITPAFVARLVAAQFPQWAHLPVTPVELDGRDNTTLRLRREYSVRLPSGDAHVAPVDKEHRWLPVLARQLPLPI